MGRNFKERGAYRYLHNIGKVSADIMLRLRKKWNRHNYDWDEERERLARMKDRASRREMKLGLEEFERNNQIQNNVSYRRHKKTTGSKS